MYMVEAIKAGVCNYFNFKGRATRSECLYFLLFVFLFFNCTKLAITDYSEISAPIMLLKLVCIFPCVSLIVRRLRDIQKSWLWVFSAIIPLGYYILLTFAFFKTKNPSEVAPNSLVVDRQQSKIHIHVITLLSVALAVTIGGAFFSSLQGWSWCGRGTIFTHPLCHLSTGPVFILLALKNIFIQI